MRRAHERLRRGLQPKCKQYRLRRLQVRRRRKQCAGIEFFGCTRQQMARDRLRALCAPLCAVVRVERERRCYLIVATTPGMQVRTRLGH